MKDDAQKTDNTPTRAEAEEAVRVLLRWIGDDPGREGLRDTPRRVIDAYREYFSGYAQSPHEILNRTFDEVEGYDEIVLLRDIEVESHCEHHMAPIHGVAHVAYLPTNRVVGISKLARAVDIYACRLQTQETMTAQIANAIEDVLQPRGVAVIVEAVHECMTTRGVKKETASMVTAEWRGEFRDNEEMRRNLFALLNEPTLDEAELS